METGKSQGDGVGVGGHQVDVALGETVWIEVEDGDAAVREGHADYRPREPFQGVIRCPTAPVVQTVPVLHLPRCGG